MITVFAMSNPRYQPDGVAVYRNYDEVFKEMTLQARWGDDPEKMAEVFLDHCSVVKLKEFPDNGYFPTFEEFEAAKA